MDSCRAKGDGGHPSNNLLTSHLPNSPTTCWGSLRIQTEIKIKSILVQIFLSFDFDLQWRIASESGCESNSMVFTWIKRIDVRHLDFTWKEATVI
jgi:hypothetical protein